MQLQQGPPAGLSSAQKTVRQWQLFLRFLGDFPKTGLRQSDYSTSFGAVEGKHLTDIQFAVIGFDSTRNEVMLRGGHYWDRQQRAHLAPAAFRCPVDLVPKKEWRVTHVIFPSVYTPPFILEKLKEAEQAGKTLRVVFSLVVKQGTPEQWGTGVTVKLVQVKDANDSLSPEQIIGRLMLEDAGFMFDGHTASPTPAISVSSAYPVLYPAYAHPDPKGQEARSGKGGKRGKQDKRRRKA